MGIRSFVAAAISSLGLSILIQWEAVRTTAYLDSAGIWTICVGHTKGVYQGMKATRDQCDVWLKEDLKIAERAVQRFVTYPISQNQYDALVIFTFNVGVEAFRTSTLLRKLNAGDIIGASNEFPRWNKERDPKTKQHRVSKGLTNRRKAEQQLFLKDYQ